MQKPRFSGTAAAKKAHLQNPGFCRPLREPSGGADL